MVALDGDTVGGAKPGRGAPGAGGMGVDTQSERYAIDPDERRHLATSHVLAIAAVAVVAVWSRELWCAVLCALLVAACARSKVVFVIAIAVAVGGVERSGASWQSLAPDELGHYTGWVRLVDDPQPYPSSIRLIAEVDGERYEIWVRGRARQLRAERWRGGEWVAVSGNRRDLAPERAQRVAWQHVVGVFDVDWVGDVRSGGRLDSASNRLRAAIERAGEHVPEPDGALFRGLVVGDDRDQPRAMIERFRASGLSHLTAVSGQNVSFVLAASGPLLRRCRPALRLALTCALIAWFVALTRFEPSIVRAGVMAALSATAFALGRERSALRILGVAVTALVLVDPLLVWSVGFWLSVGATAGVSGAGPWIAARLEQWRPLRRVALPLGVTLGAQLGVAIPSVLVFSRLPLVSVPANLAAVPVASAVMLYGLPAGLVAGWIPQLAPVLMFPIRYGTRWVDSVAHLGARLEPGPAGQAIGWVLTIIVLVAVVAFSRNTAERHGDLPLDR